MRSKREAGGESSVATVTHRPPQRLSFAMGGWGRGEAQVGSWIASFLELEANVCLQIPLIAKGCENLSRASGASRDLPGG